MAAPPPAFRIRTIAYFTGAVHSTEAEWDAEVARAAEFLGAAKRLYEGAGYEVQTTRLVTRALSAATSAASAAATAALLERLCLARGLTFLSLGDTSDEQLLRDGVFSEIAALTNHTSCSFSWRPGMGLGTARQLATVIHGLEEGKPGASFRFGVGFNCRPGIPYFPCAAAPAGGAGFAVGTENSGLLHAAFQQAATQAAPGGSRSILDLAHYCLHATFAQALQPVEALAHQLSAATGCPYMGIDASIAPALEPPSLSAAYELVGLGKFGGAGTLAISERITAALKSLPLRLCGYSGLMLPVCEDSGLAAAADEGRLSVGSLLHWSAVCGCGLDTVPVPGASREQPEGERRALLDATAALLFDVAALAFRLDKPLSVRLLPVPGAKAGHATTFDSPYLLNCKTLALV